MFAHRVSGFRSTEARFWRYERLVIYCNNAICTEHLKHLLFLGNSKQANDLEKADEITKNGSTAADSTTNNGVNS